MKKNFMIRTAPILFMLLSCTVSTYAAKSTMQGHSTSISTSSTNTNANTTNDDNNFANDDPTIQAFPSQPTVTSDPLIRFNRAMFSFNDGLDNVVMRPIASIYNKIIPKPLNLGINNFFNNIGELPTIANDILQLHFYQMTNDMWRFIVNSTVGIGGIFDVASRINLTYYKNDFGLTLARYGYLPSTYLVIPFFGPSTFRDGISIPVDYYAFSIYPHIYPESIRYQIFGLGIIDRRAQLLKYQSVMDEAAIDKYVFLRDAFIQSRTYQIEQNKRLGFKERMSESGQPTSE